MDDFKLARYCELKLQISRIEDELEELREEIVDAYSENAELSLGDYSLKIIYQECIVRAAAGGNVSGQQDALLICAAEMKEKTCPVIGRSPISLSVIP